MGVPDYPSSLCFPCFHVALVQLVAAVIPRTKASPEILQPQFYNTGKVEITNQFKPIITKPNLVKQLYKS